MFEPAPKKVLGAVFLLFALLCMGCPMELEIECNGKTVAAIVEIKFVANENYYDGDLRKKASGAYMEIGIKSKPGSNLQECCPEGGQLVFRQWIRKNVETYQAGWVVHQPNVWHKDLGPGKNPNLPIVSPAPEQAKEGFVGRWGDKPAQPLSRAKDGDFEFEAVTAFGVVKDGKFTPLAAFTWGYSFDSDGDVDLDGPSSLSLSSLKNMKLP